MVMQFGQFLDHDITLTPEGGKFLSFFNIFLENVKEYNDVLYGAPYCKEMELFPIKPRTEIAIHDFTE